MTLSATELEMRSVDDRYRMLVDAITDYAIYMLDASGHVTSWNAGARRFKGYSESEILGEHPQKGAEHSRNRGTVRSRGMEGA